MSRDWRLRRIIGSSTLINRGSSRSSSSSHGVRVERGRIGTPGGLVQAMGPRRGSSSSMMRGLEGRRHAVVMHGRRRGRMRVRMGRMGRMRMVQRMVMRAGIGRERFGFVFCEDIHD